MIRVILQRPYTHQGQRCDRGDTIDVAPIEALALTYQRIATLAPLRAYRTAVLVPDSPPHRIDAASAERQPSARRRTRTPKTPVE